VLGFIARQSQQGIKRAVARRGDDSSAL